MLKSILKIASIFIFLALGAYVLQAVEPSQEAYKNLIEEQFKAHGAWGIMLYIGFAGLMVCFAVPRQLISFVGGYAFGAFLGTVFATLATGLGCVLSFFYARFVGQKYVQRKFGNKIQRMEKFLSKNTYYMTLIIRLLPIGNNLATNMLAGMTKIKPLPFILGSITGYIPQNFIFSLLGTGIQLGTYTQVIVSALLLIVATLLGWYLYHKNKKNISEIE